MERFWERRLVAGFFGVVCGLGLMIVASLGPGLFGEMWSWTSPDR